MFANKKVETCWNLACGLGLPVAATTLAMASGAGAGAGAVMLGVTGGLFGAAGGLWQNLYAEKRGKDLGESEAERDRIFNHDLAKAVAQSIATLLGPLADDEQFSKQSRQALAAMCKQSEQVWITMADESQPVFAPLLEEQLAQAVTVNPEDPSLGAYGTAEMWKQVIATMATGAGGDVAEKLAGDRAAWVEAVRVCHAGFARQFFNDLKHDFATKGQAFAAIQLRMMGELVTLARAQAESNTEVHEKLDALTEAVARRGEEVVAWVGDGDGDKVRGAERLARLRPLTSWLKSIDRRLDSIDRKADEMISRLKKIEKQGVRTEGAVREGTSTTGKRVAAAHEKTRKHLGLYIGGGAVLVVVAVLVTFAVSSSHNRKAAAQAEAKALEIAAQAEAKAEARVAEAEAKAQERYEGLVAILDKTRQLPTQSLDIDGNVTTTNPSFTDEDRAIAAGSDDSDDPLTRALAAIIEGDTEGARAELAKMPDPAQTAFDYYTALGDSYYFEQRYDEAAPQYELALNMLGSEPTPKAIMNLANALARSIEGDTAANASRAIELYTQIIEMPDAIPSWIAMVLVSRGIGYGQQGRPAEAIADFTRVIDMPGAPVELVAWALGDRGVTHGQQSRPSEATADFTSVIDMPGAPVELVAKALNNRGVVYFRQGNLVAAISDFDLLIELAEAPLKFINQALIARDLLKVMKSIQLSQNIDWTAVIEMPGAPTKLVAMALIGRGITFSGNGRPEEAIVDFTRVIDMDGAPVEQVAKALNNRGGMHDQQGRSTEAIADYTRVIEMPGAPVEVIALALYNRSAEHEQQGHTAVAIADYTRVIDLPGAPVDLVANAIVSRGFMHRQQGQMAESIADFTRVIDLSGAPVDQLAWAFVNRGTGHGQQGRLPEAIADYTRVIDLPGAPVGQLVWALYLRGLSFAEQGRPVEAIEDFTRAIDMPGAPARQVADALYNRGLLRKTTASTKAAACADFARASRLYASIGNADMQGKADQQRQCLGCDD